MRIVIAPDSFKGCLNALDVAKAMRRGVQRVYPDSAASGLTLLRGSRRFSRG